MKQEELIYNNIIVYYSLIHIVSIHCVFDYYNSPPGVDELPLGGVQDKKNYSSFL